MENENMSTIWPILYFKTDWPERTYNFDLGVQLIKADKDTLKAICGLDTYTYTTNTSGSDDLLWNTDWFLAMRLPEPTEHVCVRELGMSFRGNVQEAIVGSFLMCLRLVRRTAAICPVGLEARIRGDCIDNDSIGEDDFYGINFDSPPVYLPETFKVGDLQLLTDLWSVIVKLRKLDYWKDEAFEEQFFVSLDSKATENAEKELRELLLSIFPKEDQKIFKKKISSIIKQAKTRGRKEGLWQEVWTDCFREAFARKEEDTFSDRTRIGRALRLYNDGLRLPKLHAFLSMCLVLETLFTIGKGEITHKFAVRLAKILGSDKNIEKRKEIHKRAKDVYKERGNVVHGEKLIETINPKVLDDAFILARHSLQCILLSAELLPLYSHPGTTDRELKKDKKMQSEAKEALRNYFLHLDLGPN